MALVTHLCGNTVLSGGHLHQASLFNRMRAGLLHIDVLAHLHRQHGDREVHVVRRRNRHAVELVAQIFEHLAVVLVDLRARIAVDGVAKTAAVHIAQADDFRAGMDRAMDVRFTFARATNADNLHILTFRDTLRRTAKPTHCIGFGRKPRDCRRRNRAFDETTT